MKRSTALAILLALITLALASGSATAQASPPEPAIVYQSTLAVPAPPPQIDMVQVFVEFGPGTSTPSHTHGGQVLVMMLDGALSYGVGNNQQTYVAGQSWVENPQQYGIGRNPTKADAHLVATYLLVKGAPLTTVENAGATDQLPAGPKTLSKSTLELASPPAQFDMVQLVLDFAPGAWTSQYPFGGQALATVLSGNLTVRGKDGADRLLKPGDSLSELSANKHTIGNAGSEPARLVVAVILPKGTHLTLAEPARSPSSPATLPRTGAADFGSTSGTLLLIAAALLIGGWRLAARKRTGQTNL